MIYGTKMIMMNKPVTFPCLGETCFLEAPLGIFYFCTFSDVFSKVMG